MLEQFQKRIEKSQKDIKSISLAHKYMTSHFLGLIHALQYNKWGLKLVCYHLSHEESQQITCMCRLAYVRWSCEIWNILIEHA